MIIDYRQCHPDIEIVVQVGVKAFEQINDDPSELVQKLKEYGTAIDFVLLDRSMGKGKPLDSDSLKPFLFKVSHELPHLGLAVAGGLGPTSLHLIEPLLDDFPELSFDAQGKLRPSGNSEQPIDWHMASDYLEKSLALTH